MVKVIQEIHKHSTDCERATSPKKYCKCKCGGALHGISARIEDFCYYPDNTITPTKEMGGKLIRMVNKLEKQKIPCRFCESIINTKTAFAYPHDDGLEDKNGKGWWLFYFCPKCDHQWAWWKLNNLSKEINKGMVKD